MMRGLILTLAVTTAGLFVACSGGGGERYPQYYENQFVAGCADTFSGDPDFSGYCHCMLTYVEKHLSFEDFVALDEDMTADPDYSPQIVKDVVLACADEVPAGYQPLTPQDAPEF